MSKFQDVELEYKDSVFKVPANKVMKLIRAVSPLAKMEYFVEIESKAADELYLFSDAYAVALSYGVSDEQCPDEEEVLLWMGESDDNLQAVLQNLMIIKSLFKEPDGFLKKTGVPSKKKKATRKSKK